VILVAVSTVFGVLLSLGGVGMLLGWSAVSSDWDELERTVAGLFTLASGVMFLFLCIGVARQCVVGYPQARGPNRHVAFDDGSRAALSLARCRMRPMRSFR